MERVEYKRDNHLLKGGEGGRKVFIYSKVNYLENLDTLYEKKNNGFRWQISILAPICYVANRVRSQYHSFTVALLQTCISLRLKKINRLQSRWFDLFFYLCKYAPSLAWI